MGRNYLNDYLKRNVSPSLEGCLPPHLPLSKSRVSQFPVTCYAFGRNTRRHLFGTQRPSPKKNPLTLITQHFTGFLTKGEGRQRDSGQGRRFPPYSSRSKQRVGAKLVYLLRSFLHMENFAPESTPQGPDLSPSYLDPILSQSIPRGKSVPSGCGPDGCPRTPSDSFPLGVLSERRNRT